MEELILLSAGSPVVDEIDIEATVVVEVEEGVAGAP